MLQWCIQSEILSYVSKQEVFLDQFLFDHVNYWKNSVFPKCFLCIKLISIDYAFLLDWHYGWRILKGICVFPLDGKYQHVCL